jgi:hypothetical protein
MVKGERGSEIRRVHVCALWKCGWCYKLSNRKFLARFSERLHVLISDMSFSCAHTGVGQNIGNRMDTVHISVLMCSCLHYSHSPPWNGLFTSFDWSSAELCAIPRAELLQVALEMLGQPSDLTEGFSAVQRWSLCWPRKLLQCTSVLLAPRLTAPDVWKGALLFWESTSLFESVWIVEHAPEHTSCPCTALQ